MSLRTVENSINHPKRSPTVPMAMTIAIFVDLTIRTTFNDKILSIQHKKGSIIYLHGRKHLVAPVSANRAVRIDTVVWIALLEASSIVAIYTKVLTTAMNESQKSRNCSKREVNQSTKGTT